MAEFEVRDLNPVLGAEISGIDLSSQLDADTVARLRATFDDRGVLLFRDLELAAEDQAYIAGLLVGPTAPADRASAEANSSIYADPYSNKVEGGYAPTGRLLYHSDSMWADTPGQLLSLYGLEVGQPSVPTTFVSTVYAWATLPAALKDRVAGLEAEQATGQRQRADDNDELLKATHDATRTTVKPIGWTHPRTGRPILYVSEMVTTRIMGMEPDASEELLQELFAHLYGDPANFYQHEWRAGDLLIWDNLATQHGRPNLTREAPERTLRKVIAPKPDYKMAKPKFEGASASS